ncbi:uncharacterized protein CDAR_606301 [Caerostris darwini]|uniref:G domain-containing protein n=1 Tax=Caerostris darwini TaxID=1538125 RepID=A0AAV4PBB2_9ARAC|nr:uncharacterized protein CDAR_606301 [Caerostris darwini]
MLRVHQMLHPLAREGDNNIIKSTFDLLEKGEKDIQLSDEHKNIVLVLGNTGSGKSTFTQWVAGDNSKLIAKEVKEGTGEFIIEDNNKRIGDSSLKSKTVFPELVVDPKTNISYYDCPGFSDTRSTSNDIATTYFIKKVVDYSEKVKLVFIISHPSLRKGVDRQDFMKLVKHATDLVKDIDKFKNSIAIVASKVDNQYKDKRFYENAIKFVDVISEKDGDVYPKIGIFRRPDEAGPLSKIQLLQEGKQKVDRMLYETLNFTEKVEDDFGYTVSEKSKNDISDLVEEINKNVWSSVGNIAEKMQGYYHNLVDQVRHKLHSFISDTSLTDVDAFEAEALSHKISKGYTFTSGLVENLKNLTDPQAITKQIKDSITNLGMDLPINDLQYIENQGKYFNFLKTASDKKLNTKPWEKPFTGVVERLTESKKIIQADVGDAVKVINNRIHLDLEDITKIMHERHTEQVKLLEIQKLPVKLNKEKGFMLSLAESMKNQTLSVEELVNTIYDIADNLGIGVPEEQVRNIANQGKYFKFLQNLSDEELVGETSTWIHSFENFTEYFYELEKWYMFLESLRVKFSEYEIQKDRQKYNVAELENWGQSGKPQGIAITPNTFEKFLTKIANFNLTEYDSIKHLPASGLQLEELNQVLSLTLKHRTNIRCSGQDILVEGSYIRTEETVKNILNNLDGDENCKSLLKSNNPKFLNVFALNALFIDNDVSFKGRGISTAFIAPKWEIVGNRTIDLSGADGKANTESKAKSGQYPGNSGVNGKPGNPGGSGGSFFGIGHEFVNGENLTVASNGGEGSSGQDGGNGFKGQDGRTPDAPASSVSPCNGHGTVNGFKCEYIDPKDKEKSSGFSMNILAVVMVFPQYKTSEIYKFYGLPGGKGGDGGNGGKAGKGGHPGNITVLKLGGHSGISEHAIVGHDGKNGTAGTGAPGGKDGNDVGLLWTKDEPNPIEWLFGKRTKTYWELKQTFVNNKKGPSGHNGVDGANDNGYQEPEEALIINEPTNIINRYKSYLIENLNDRFTKYSLTHFFEELNSNGDVKSIYNTSGLVNELRNLEEQLPVLSGKVDFIPFYQSLLNRINEYVLSPKSAEKSDEYKKILAFLYTAALGQIYSLKNDSEPNLIIDIGGYLDLVIKDLQKLKESQSRSNKVDVVNRRKEDYKKSIDRKIQEAKKFVKEQLTPEIDKISRRIDNDVDSLIEETVELQKQAEKEEQVLKNKKQDLEKAMAIKGIFSTFQFVGDIVSFLGPVGAVAGTVIGTATSVGESLVLSNQQQSFEIPSDLLSDLKTLEGQIKMVRKKKIAHLNELLEEVSQEIKKNPKKLKDVLENVDDIKRRLNQMTEKEYDFKKVKALEGELKQKLKAKEDALKTDKKNLDALKVVGKISQIVQFGSSLFDIYKKNKNDRAKIDAITDAIDKIKDKIRNLQQYETSIYDTIAPMLQDMENNLLNITNKLSTKSHVALDVTKWQVQSVLKDIKLQMQRLTSGFEVKDDLSRCIEKLDEVMTTLINIFDRIQNYQEQQDFANYIADINSPAANSINVNQKLAEAVKFDKLETSITSNLVLREYKAVVNAFKQWVFPFAHIYLEESMLPPQLELEKNIENLVSKAAKEVDNMKSKLDLYKTSVKKTDKYIHNGEFNSRYVSSEPFYVWNNQQHKSVISELLSGKTVVLKADVNNSAANKDAIKFSFIDLYFHSRNETIQSRINSTLKGFDVSATHLGNSYYRYDNKIYLITSESQSIVYSCEKNELGEPIRTNNVYDKIKNGDLMLSPYTLWEIK